MFEEESRKKGLELNIKKTEEIEVSRNVDCTQINILINGNQLKKGSIPILGYLNIK